MTVESATATASYTGNGSTAIFPIPFYFLVDTDLKVSKLTAAGVSSVLVLNSDYTVTGAGVEAGGSITTIPALPNGDEIYIERNVVAVQETAYPSNGPFPSASHERALDRLTMLVQQAAATLGLTLQRAPLAGSFDAEGFRIGNVGNAVDPTDVTPLGQVMQAVAAAAITPSVPATDVALLSRLGALSPTSGADLIAYASGESVGERLANIASGSGAGFIGYLRTNGAFRSLKAKLDSDVLSALDFNVDSTGVADSTVGLQAALNAAAGKQLLIPPGVYNITDACLIPSNTTVLGYGAILNRVANCDNVLRNAADGVTGGYTAASNIRIYGLTILGNGTTYTTPASLFAFGHCTGIRIRDCVLDGCPTYHNIEVNSSNDVIIDGCRFTNWTTTLDTAEGIQIDGAIGTDQFPWFGPYDNTMCRGVTIRDCVFDTGGSGIGSHSPVAGSSHQSIQVLNCSFKNLSYKAIKAYGWSGVLFSGNKIDTVETGIYVFQVSGNTSRDIRILNNSIINTTARGIYVQSNNGTSRYENVIIANNYLRTIGSYGISEQFGYNVVITGNTVSVCTNDGISSVAGTHVVVSNNNVSDNTGQDIKLGQSGVTSTSYNCIGNSTITLTANYLSKSLVTGNLVGTTLTTASNTTSSVHDNLINGTLTGAGA